MRGEFAVVNGGQGGIVYRQGRRAGAAPAGVVGVHPDGSGLLVLAEDGNLHLAPLEPDPATVCARAGRTLSPAEWHAYVRDVCA